MRGGTGLHCIVLKRKDFQAESFRYLPYRDVHGGLGQGDDVRVGVPREVLTFGSSRDFESELLGHYIYLNEIVRVSFFNVFNYLFYCRSHQGGVRSGTIYVTCVTQRFLSKDPCVPVLELVPNRNSAERLVRLTLVLLGVGAIELHVGDHAGKVVDGRDGVLAGDVAIPIFLPGCHAGEGQG
ncbi:MAG: hypothetical protein ACK56I_02850, partial [bacterium]